MLLRRLLLLSAVFLVLLALAQSFVPDDLKDDDGGGAASAAPGAAVTGRTVTATLPSRKAVRAHVGDLVRLTVKARTPDSVSIVGLDRIVPVETSTPALFEFVADRVGEFPIVLTLSKRTVGRLEIRSR